MKYFFTSAGLAVSAVLAAALFSAPAGAHPGGLDAKGCHHDTKAGDYHCHQGDSAGRSFASEEAMQKGSRGTMMESRPESRESDRSIRERRDSEPRKTTRSRESAGDELDTERKTEKKTRTRNKKDDADVNERDDETKRAKKDKKSSMSAQDSDSEKSTRTAKKRSEKKEASGKKETTAKKDSKTDKDSKAKKTKKKSSKEKEAEKSTGKTNQ